MPFIYDKISEAIDKNDRDECDILFVEDHELDWDKWDAQSRLNSMWFDRWLCTDTHVGGKILFFDDKPFALSYQPGRKSDKTIVIFNTVIAEEVKEFMSTMLLPHDIIDSYDIVDMMYFSSDDLENLVYGVNKLNP